MGQIPASKKRRRIPPQKSKVTLCSEQAGGRFVTRERPAGKPRGTHGYKLWPRLQTLLRSLLKQKPVDIPDLYNPSQTLPKATTDLCKAELLNQFFISQSRQSALPGAVPPIGTPRSPLVLDRFQVTSKFRMDCGQSTRAKPLVLMRSHLNFSKW